MMFIMENRAELGGRPGPGKAAAAELPPTRAPAAFQTCSVRTKVGPQEGLDLALLSESQTGQAEAGKADVPFTQAPARAPFRLEEAEGVTVQRSGW